MQLFKRKAYEDLLKWKRERDGRSAVLLEGARRVGKSTLAETFGRNEYRSFILVDFSPGGEDYGLADMLDSKIKDLDQLFLSLQLNSDTVLYERDSLIILDEIQNCPIARSMIKHLVKDGRYDYIETGSLISLKSNTRGIQIPSEEHRIDLHPMDFEEFLWATGEGQTLPMMKGFFESGKPLGDSVHRTFMGKFRTYMVIGGMPQAVERYIETNNVMSVDEIKREIIELYRNDILRIPGNIGARTLDLFDRMPTILSSPHKVFQPGAVEKGRSSRYYDSSIKWLCEAQIFLKCRCNPDPSIAAGLNENGLRPKYYLLDTGLLISLAFGNDRSMLLAAYKRLVDGDLSINEGMFFENAVAQMLVANGHGLWFVEMERDGGGRKYEVDFFIPGLNGVIPIEVKSGASSKHRSLDVMIERYGDRIPRAYVVHTKDQRVDGKIRYIPAYMTQFLRFC